MNVFDHPWDTKRHLAWSGILGISGTTKSGKTRVALEYGVGALLEGRTVIAITNDWGEEKLHKYILERRRGWNGLKGKFVTRTVNANKDILQQIATYSIQGDLIIIDQPDFTAAGMSIQRGFEAMRSANNANDCSFVVTIAASLNGRRLPFPRSDKMLTHLDVCMGLQWGMSKRRSAFEEGDGDELTDSDEEIIKDMERALMGEKLLQVGCLKNRNASPSEMWTCVDINTMEKVGEAPVGEQR